MLTGGHWFTEDDRHLETDVDPMQFRPSVQYNLAQSYPDDPDTWVRNDFLLLNAPGILQLAVRQQYLTYVLDINW